METRKYTQSCRVFNYYCMYIIDDKVSMQTIIFRARELLDSIFLFIFVDMENVSLYV